jgi:GR25 family glycosyltransferase involved in LPS biosynthesis
MIFILLLIVVILLISIFYFIGGKKEKFTDNNNNIDKIYVINLKKNQDRLEKFMENAKKANVDVERFDAVYGKELSKDHPDILKYFVKDHGLNPGQIGCALSHVKIWEDAIKNNYNNILVFEDDAIIPEDFWDRFNEAYNELPKDWDFSYLALNWAYVRKISNNISKVIYKEGLYNLGTHAMIVNINKIAKLLNIKINVPIDVFIKNNNKVLYLFHNMKLINDPLFESTIISGRLSDNTNIIKNKITFVNKK